MIYSIKLPFMGFAMWFVFGICTERFWQKWFSRSCLFSFGTKAMWLCDAYAGIFVDTLNRLVCAGEFS